jgi:hypothetical protein
LVINGGFKVLMFLIDYDEVIEKNIFIGKKMQKEFRYQGFSLILLTDIIITTTQLINFYFKKF